MTPRPRRRARAGERGLTLIELLVTIALMGGGMVAMVGLFSTVTLSVGVTNADAQLAVQMRQVGDYVESEQFAYIECGTVAGYDTALQTAITASKVALPSGVTAHVIALAQASGGTQTVSGVPTAAPALAGCNNGTSADYGVQQVEVKVTSQTHTLTRIVYKRWN